MTNKEKLLQACKDGDLNTVQKIINRRILHPLKKKLVNGARDTPLYLASQHGHTDLVKLLIKTGADPNNGNSPLAAASRGGFLEIVKFLIHSEADLKGGYHNHLTAASSAGHIEIVKNLIDAGTNLNEIGDPLLKSLESGHQEIFNLLVRSGVNLDKSNALYYAAKEGDIVNVRLLAKVGINASNANKALAGAAQNGHLEIVKLLIKSGADLEDAESALSNASDSGHIEIVRLLIESGVDMNLAYKALKNALQGGYTEIAKLLIESNVNVNGPDYDKNKPLMIASRQGFLELVYLLIISGAKIDARDSEGETALMIAGDICESFEQFKQVAQIFFIAVKDGDKIPDSEIKDIWEKIKTYYTKKRSRYSGYSSGRESTAKGSIGHDRLNVKTHDRIEWERRIQVISKQLLVSSVEEDILF